MLQTAIYITAKPPKALWIKGFILFLTAVLAAGQSLQAQSIIKDSSAYSVDTLVQANSGLEDVVDYEAEDSVVLDLEARVAHLYGNAHVKYQDLDLTAAYIRIDFTLRQLFAKGLPDSSGKIAGLPLFKSDDLTSEIDSFTYDLESKRARLSGVRFEEEGNYIICKNVFKEKDGSILTDVGKLTTCNLAIPHFHFEVNKLKIIPKDKVICGPANLVIENVPTPLFIPFGIFPVKKNPSGLVFPAFQNGGIRGFGFTNLGWHFNISDYVNLTVNADLFFGGTYRLGAASQYRKKYKYTGGATISYGYNINQGAKVTNDLQSSTDYSISWQHNEDPKNKPGRTFSANVNINGGNFNQNVIQNQARFGNNQFNSTINYSKTLIKNRLTLNTRTSASQNTNLKTITVTAPDVTLTMQRVLPFKNSKSNKKQFFDNLGFSYNGSFSNNITKSDSNLLDLSAWREPWQNASKVISHNIPVSMAFSFFKNYFNIAPFFTYQEKWHFQTFNLGIDTLTNLKDTIAIGRNTFGREYNYSYGATLETTIFGTYLFKKGKIKGIRHAINPSIGFSYTPNFASLSYGVAQSYRDTTTTEIFYNRFTGDNMTSQEQGNINFNLGNIINAKVRDTGKTTKIINIIDLFSISGNYNLLADSQALSKIRTALNTTLFGFFTINSSATLNPFATNNENRNLNQYLFQTNGKLASLTQANIVFSFSLNPELNKKREKEKQLAGDNAYALGIIRRQLLDFSIPWSIKVNGNANYNSFTRDNTSKWTLVPSFDGDISITPLWKIVFTSGYDVIGKQIAQTTRIGIARSLHCWDIQFDWYPIGERRSFTFVIRPNASSLSSLELKKQFNWWDLF